MLLDAHVIYHYYTGQAGRGGEGEFYRSQIRIQRGRGLGSFVSRLWTDWVQPLIWRGAKAAGNQVLRTGGQILQDLAVPDNQTKQRAKDIALSRAEEGLTQLGSTALKTMVGRWVGRSVGRSVRQMHWQRLQIL